MPSVSKKQANFMRAVAHSPEFAKKAGVPQSVGKEFAQADKGRKFGRGGPQTRPEAQKINRPQTNQGKGEFFAKGGDMKAKKMAMGGMGSMPARANAAGAMRGQDRAAAMSGRAMPSAGRAPTTMAMANGGITKAKMGAVRTAAPSKDGIASKGKTKGMMVKMGAAKPLGMKRGGKC